MYQSTMKGLSWTVVLCLTGWIFCGIISKNQSLIVFWATATMATAIAIILCYWSYHDGIGRPKSHWGLVFESLYQVENIGKDFAVIRPCRTDSASKSIIPTDEVIVCDKLPEKIGAGAYIVVGLETDDSLPSITEWHPPEGYRVHH